MRVGLAQVDSRVGDLSANARNVREAVEALTPGAPEVILLPELVLTGYPPRDLLFDPDFVAAALNAQERLARELEGAPPVLLGGLWPGTPQPRHPGLYNAALLVHNGEVRLAQAKRLLPTYDLFFEARWFLPGPTQPPLTFGEERAGVLVCEDLWQEGYPLRPVDRARAAGATVLFSLSASPYRQGSMARRLAHARSAGLPIVYINAVGANDEMILDGGSFALNGAGGLVAMLPRFEEAVDIVDLGGGVSRGVSRGVSGEPVEDLDTLRQALVAGIRGFARKNGLRSAVIGLSGGVDSALVAALACEALGPSRITCLALPSRFTDPRSTQSAEELARSLGCRFEVQPIEGLHTAAEALLGPGVEGDTTLENVQARLRMMLLMARVNREGGMLLNTSNKTELALGYSTLYGDMAGALAPIGDLGKHTVFALARHVGGIPAFILDRAPTAELRADQVDPFDYATVGPAVDSALRRAAGLGGEALEADLARRLRAAEHKRWQAPIVLKVSETAFGSGRVMPVTRG